MGIYHPGACETHDFLHLLPQGSPITMDRTPGTGGFLLLKGASIQPGGGIIHEGLTIFAQVILTTMKSLTIEGYHGGYGFLFTFESR